MVERRESKTMINNKMRDMEMDNKMKANNKMKDMEFAKQIFKAWDTSQKGYLTAREMSEQLVGLGLSVDINFV